MLSCVYTILTIGRSARPKLRWQILVNRAYLQHHYSEILKQAQRDEAKQELLYHRWWIYVQVLGAPIEKILTLTWEALFWLSNSTNYKHIKKEFLSAGTIAKFYVQFKIPSFDGLLGLDEFLEWVDKVVDFFSLLI